MGDPSDHTIDSIKYGMAQINTVLSVLEKTPDADLTYLGITPDARNNMLTKTYVVDTNDVSNFSKITVTENTKDKTDIVFSQNFIKSTYAQQLGAVAYHLMSCSEEIENTNRDVRNPAGIATGAAMFASLSPYNPLLAFYVGALAYSVVHTLATSQTSYQQPLNACHFQARFNHYITPLTDGSLYNDNHDTPKATLSGFLHNNLFSHFGNKKVSPGKAARINEKIRVEEDMYPGPRLQKNLQDVLKNTRYAVYDVRDTEEYKNQHVIPKYKNRDF